jgi:hypothetical protein
MKSGYEIEKCRLSSADRLGNYLAVISIVSFRILYMRYFQKQESKVAAKKLFSKEENEVIEKKTGIKGREITASKGVIEVAKMGGFFARKSDVYPDLLQYGED